MNPEPTRAPGGPAFARSIGAFSVVCIGLNAIVGSGIFALPDDLYRQMGPLSPVAFLVCGLGLLPIALCYAEAASGTERSGGPYLYARAAFGPGVGFGVGWMCFANSIFSFAAVSSVAAAYVGVLVPGLPAETLRLVALALVGAFSVLNYWGARPGVMAVDLFTLGKFAVLAILVIALWPGGGSTALRTAPPTQGFEVAPVTAGETRAPTRSVPFAVVASLLGASLLYVLVQTTLVLRAPGLAAATDTPLADAARSVAPWLGVVVAGGGLISTLGFVSGSALGTPRYLYAPARDGELPGWLGAIHPRYHTPHRAIAATGALVSLLVLALDYRALIGISNVAVAVQYLATCGAVLRMRRSPNEARFRAPGGVWTPCLGMALSLWIFTEASSVELLWAAAALAIGLCVRALSRSRGGDAALLEESDG